MKQQAVYDRLREAVQKCVSPIRKIDFSAGEWGLNENVVTCAYVTFMDKQLAPYDQAGLLALIGGTLVDATDKTAVFVGKFDGHKYEVRLKCREQ